MFLFIVAVRSLVKTMHFSGFILSKNEMEKVIFSVMNTIQKNTQLIQSFFRMPDTEYAL